MPTSYTSLLGLALPVTGELSGTWGDTVNDYITQYLDASVAGTQTISGSQTAVTLSKTTATSLSQAGSGATGSSQYNIINCTGNPASMLTVTVPAASKTYVVVNATSTNQDVKIVGAGPTTGVTLVAGEKAVIAWNGSDFIKVATSTADGVTTLSFGSTGLTPSTATSGAVTVAGTLVAANGGTGQSSYTTGDLLYATGSTALSKLGIGTNGQILTSTGTAPQWSTLSGVAVTTFSAGTTGFTPSSATSGAVTLAGTLATTNGGTGLTSFTANGVVYASSSSALTTGSALTFDGTEFKVNAASGNVLIQPSNVANAKLYMRHGSIANNNGFEVDVSGNTIFLQAGSEQMRLTSTGLGIGTSSPAAYAKLTVSGTAGVQTGASQQIVINAPTTTAGQGAGIRFNAASGANEAVGVIGLINEASGNSGAMTFHVYNAGANIPEYMRLSSLGNLGIGTDAPATKLVLATPDSSTTGQLRFARSADVSYFWEIGRDNNLTGDFIFSNASGGAKTERMRLDSSGNLGLGVTPSAWGGGLNGTGLQVGAYTSIASANAFGAGYGFNFYYDGTNYRYVASTYASLIEQSGGAFRFKTAASGTAGNAISFTQAMTLNANGNLGVGTTSPNKRLTVAAEDTTNAVNGVAGLQIINTSASAGGRMTSVTFGGRDPSNFPFAAIAGVLVSDIAQEQAGDLAFYTKPTTTAVNPTERMRILAAGFTQPVAYADTVSALGNTGTAKTIDLTTANVFTATLTGNCTFTLSNPIATGSSSFTLILTNDGTAGRTVAWAGGSFVFPGGAAALSRTTTANAVDVWVFFTPNGGTTWYGNIAMKDMKA